MDNTTKEILEGFKEEFGIHFKDAKGELQFALAFIEEALKKNRERIDKEIEKNIGQLRQWLNEERITFGDKMVTTKELKVFLINQDK